MNYHLLSYHYTLQTPASADVFPLSLQPSQITAISYSCFLDADRIFQLTQFALVSSTMEGAQHQNRQIILNYHRVHSLTLTMGRYERATRQGRQQRREQYENATLLDFSTQFAGFKSSTVIESRESDFKLVIALECSNMQLDALALA